MSQLTKLEAEAKDALAKGDHKRSKEIRLEILKLLKGKGK